MAFDSQLCVGALLPLVGAELPSLTAVTAAFAYSTEEDKNSVRADQYEQVGLAEK